MHQTKLSSIKFEYNRMFLVTIGKSFIMFYGKVAYKCIKFQDQKL